MVKYCATLSPFLILKITEVLIRAVYASNLFVFGSLLKTLWIKNYVFRTLRR